MQNSRAEEGHTERRLLDMEHLLLLSRTVSGGRRLTQIGGPLPGLSIFTIGSYWALLGRAATAKHLVLLLRGALIAKVHYSLLSAFASVYCSR